MQTQYFSSDEQKFFQIFYNVFVYYLFSEVIAAKRAMLTQYFSRVVKLNRNSYKRLSCLLNASNMILPMAVLVIVNN